MKRTTYTKAPTANEYKKTVYVVDVQNQIVGRCATRIAHLLQGKSKPGYAKNADMGDDVVVLNGSAVRVTGKKALDKDYETYTGYPGGLKSETYGDLLKRNPEVIIRRAVKGMLPKNKLRDRAMSRLHVFLKQEYILPVELKNLPIKIITL